MSWDYALFPPGHFDMVWASPVCTEYSRALTMRPRRLEEGDALVLRALEIMAHFDPLMWVIENPATKYGTPYRKQTRLWTNMRWRPSRGLCRSGCRCEVWEDGRHVRGHSLQGVPRVLRLRDRREEAPPLPRHRAVSRGAVPLLQASLRHEAAKPWVGCWLPGSRTTLRLGWAGLLGRVAGWARPVSYTLGPEAGWQVAGWAG